MLPPFPRAALQVLRIIRKEVEKPKDLPGRLSYQCSLRWEKMCPMGLHAGSLIPCPAASRHFADGRCDGRSVTIFGLWWDEIKIVDAQAAVDFIWPSHG